MRKPSHKEYLMEEKTDMKTSFIFVSIILIVCAGCSKNTPETTAGNSDKPLRAIFSAENFVDDDRTRTVLDDSGNFSWAATDTVGIYPDSGSQIFFVMTNGEGTGSAVFDGGGWAFRSGSVYYSYYPFIGDFYLPRNFIPVTYSGQKQKGTTSTENFGAYDFMYSGGTEVENGAIQFRYKHMSTIIRVNATLQPGNYRQLTITAPSAVFVKEGHFDLQSDTPHIIGDTMCKELTVVLEDINLTKQTTFYIYVMSAPVNLNGQQVTVSVVNSDKKQFDCKKSITREYLAGVRYGLTCNAWTEVPQTVGLAIADWGEGGSISGTAD